MTARVTFRLGAASESLYAALAFAALAAVASGASLPHLVAGAACGALLGALLSRPRSSAPRPWAEALAPSVMALFFVPLLTMAVAPGADMAMHVALARPLVEGTRWLSPAWGHVEAATYPRGLSAIVALLAPGVGYAAAGLIAAGLSQAAFFLGLRSFLRDVLAARYPSALAAVAVLLARNPQGFFSWGGNPTVLALGLGLWAIGLLGRVWLQDGRAGAAVLAALFLAGAVAVHPIGALGGASAGVALVAVIGLRHRRGETVCWRPGSAGSGLAFLAMATTMLAVKLGGPALSERELAWITDYQRTVEHVVETPSLFWWQIWRELPRVMGPAYVVVLAVAAALQVRTSAGRRRVAASAIAVVALAAVFAFGPLAPGIGFLMYPSRWTPLLIVATLPLLGHAFTELHAAAPRTALALAAVSGLLGAATHVDRYELVRPMATRNDLEVIRCLERMAPADAVVEGAYGDASQWLPALSGLAITRAHPHVSLLDEIDAAVAGRTPSYLFIGERMRYPSENVLPVPDRAPLCRAGAAAAYALR